MGKQWNMGLTSIAAAWLLLSAAAAPAQELLRAGKPIGLYLPTIEPAVEPAMLHAGKPTGVYLVGEPPLAWSDDVTTPQAPTPPGKVDPTTPDATPAPDTGGDSLGDSSGDTASTFDSAVGYIESAIPGSYVRVRFDAADRNNRPSRAEYFYAKGGPSGPGIPTFAGDIDYEIASLYLEGALNPRFSVFLDLPWRFIDPQFTDRQEGFSDLNAGFKYAFIYEPHRVMTFQFRTWAPTGDARDGLGTRHTTIEPGFLYYRQHSPKWRTEAEFLYWIPLGGTDFAGDVLQYGIGWSYGERPQCKCWVNPVVEFVGWTVLGGKEQTGPLLTDVQDAAGDTIVNAKVGFRTGYSDRWNAYFGYGRALTGEVWYKNMFRAELRIGF